MSSSGPITYTGGCKCKAHTYELEAAAPLTEVTECNCSVCSINGYILTSHEKSKLKIKDEDTLTTYVFNTKQFHHKFCPVCGTSILIDCKGGKYDGWVALNMRTVDDFDFKSATVKYIDGKSL